MHLGNTTKVLNEIADGTHPFAARMASAQLPMIIVGQGALEREDGEAIQAALKRIAL